MAEPVHAGDYAPGREAAQRPGRAAAEPIRIANCSGFYGDRLSAAARW